MTAGEIANTTINQLIFLPSQTKWKVSVSHTNGTNYSFKLTGVGNESDTTLSDMIYDHLVTVTLEELPEPGASITRNTTLIGTVPTNR